MKIKLLDVEYKELSMVIWPLLYIVVCLSVLRLVLMNKS